MPWRGGGAGVMYCSRILYNTIPMHAGVRLCWRNLHSSPRVRNNSHYQQSLLEHTEAEFATGHITTIESGTCKDGKWEEKRWREGERKGGKEERKSEKRGRQSERFTDRNEIIEEAQCGLAREQNKRKTKKWRQRTVIFRACEYTGLRIQQYKAASHMYPSTVRKQPQNPFFFFFFLVLVVVGDADKPVTTPSLSPSYRYPASVQG